MYQRKPEPGKYSDERAWRRAGYTPDWHVGEDWDRVAIVVASTLLGGPLTPEQVVKAARRKGLREEVARNGLAHGEGRLFRWDAMQGVWVSHV